MDLDIIKDVEEKTTKTNKPYKNLVLEDGKSVNMWSDDKDWDLAVPGAKLDRQIAQKGDYWNLLPAGESPSPQVSTANNEALISAIGRTNTKLEVMYELFKKMAQKLEVDVTEAVVEEEEINPEDIPF